MNVFATDKIRNVVVLGHGGCGKTSLVEALAYLTGITTRLGNVADGTTISDYDKEEQKRKFSINTSTVPIIWNNVKVTLLDTPGYFDFVGEVEEAVSAADAAIIVINGKSGVEVGTQKAWNICEKYSLPRIFYVSNMDYDHANYGEIIENLTGLYGKKVVPIQLPIREGDNLTGYVDVVGQDAYTYKEKGKKASVDVPGDMADDLETYREALMEEVAETSEEFMDRYFSGDEFTKEEVVSALRTSICECGLMPVTVGSSVNLQGASDLMDEVVAYLPAPCERKISGTNTKTGDAFEADYDGSKDKSAFVFKSIVDPFIGKYSLIKVASGSIKADDTLYDPENSNEFRISKLYVFTGSKPEEVKELKAGDIGAIAKIEAATGDTLSTKAAPIQFPKPE